MWEASRKDAASIAQVSDAHDVQMARFSFMVTSGLLKTAASGDAARA
jgi:hypothetical protein